MTTGSSNPLSRPVSVHRLPPEGTEIVVEATTEERAALAADFGLVAIESLVGRFHLAGSAHRIAVTGRVRGEVVQTCTATLDPFPAQVDEPVEVDFAEGEGEGKASRDADAEEDVDLPDPIVDGRIDLGALTAEFLALGLDPYPRKPGVSFAFEDPDADALKPFAALKSLAEKGG